MAAPEKPRIFLEATLFRLSGARADAALAPASGAGGSRRLAGDQAIALGTAWHGDPAVAMLVAPSVVVPQGEPARIEIRGADAARGGTGPDALRGPGASGIFLESEGVVEGEEVRVSLRASWRTKDAPALVEVAGGETVGRGETLLLWGPRTPGDASEARLAVIARPHVVPARDSSADAR